MLPKNITLPEKVYMSGTISGNMDDVSPNLGINTSLGSVHVDGRIQNASNPSKLIYAARVSANNLDVGTIMQNTQNLGKITAIVNATGSGLDPKTANAKFSGSVVSAQVNQYTYQNLKFDGSLA